MTGQQQDQTAENMGARADHALLYRQGRGLLDGGKVEESVGLFKEAIKETPEGKDMPFAHAYLGRALTLLGRHEEAQTHLEKALTIPYTENDRLVYRTFLADNLGFLGRHEDAVTEYEEVINGIKEVTRQKIVEKGIPGISVPAVYNRMGVSYSHLNREEDAAATFLMAARLEPGNREYAANVALFEPVLRKMKENRQASEYVEFSQHLLKIAGPRHADAVLGLLEEAVNLRPGEPQFREFLQTVREAAQGAAKVPDAPEDKQTIALAFNTVANIASNIYGDYDAAAGLFEKAAELCPDVPVFRLGAAFCRYDREEYALADAHLDEGLRGVDRLSANANETEREALANLSLSLKNLSGMVQSRLGRHEAAISLLDPAITKNTQVTTGMAHAYGVSLAALGRGDEAERFLDHAVDYEPEKARREEFRESLKSVAGRNETLREIARREAAKSGPSAPVIV